MAKDEGGYDMPMSDPLDILLEHDTWATRQMLLACEKLTAEQFGRKFDMGPGSLQATITHMIAAMNAWTDTLAQRPNRPRVDQGSVAYSVAQLLQMLEESAGEFAAVAKGHAMDEVVTRVREGKEYKFTRGAVITHVATHGMHHRAQCLNMLKQLGVKPLPLSSVVEWVRAVDDPQ
jgi:uncharacterized damage-inducible protein DinB